MRVGSAERRLRNEDISGVYVCPNMSRPHPRLYLRGVGAQQAGPAEGRCGALPRPRPQRLGRGCSVVRRRCRHQVGESGGRPSESVDHGVLKSGRCRVQGRSPPATRSETCGEVMPRVGRLRRHLCGRSSGCCADVATQSHFSRRERTDTRRGLTHGAPRASPCAQKKRAAGPRAASIHSAVAGAVFSRQQAHPPSQAAAARPAARPWMRHPSCLQSCVQKVVSPRSDMHIFGEATGECALFLWLPCALRNASRPQRVTSPTGPEHRRRASAGLSKLLCLWSNSDPWRRIPATSRPPPRT